MKGIEDDTYGNRIHFKSSCGVFHDLRICLKNWLKFFIQFQRMSETSATIWKLTKCSIYKYTDWNLPFITTRIQVVTQFEIFQEMKIQYPSSEIWSTVNVFIKPVLFESLRNPNLISTQSSHIKPINLKDTRLHFDHALDWQTKLAACSTPIGETEMLYRSSHHLQLTFRSIPPLKSKGMQPNWSITLDIPPVRSCSHWITSKTAVFSDLTPVKKCCESIALCPSVKT